jgi:DNA-binding transcriptional ArsR family regulator
VNDFDYQQLDDIIHSRIRLAIMALLITVDEADFVFVKEKVNATDGNLSVHLKKLEDAAYINVKKEFIDRKPRTIFSLSKKVINAFEDYLEQLKKMIKK